MRVLRIGSMVLAAVVAVGGSALAGDQKPSAGCAEVVAVLDAGGGGLSADEVAKKANVDVETVRTCTDQWRSTQGDPAGQGAKAAAPMPPGCAKVVAVLDAGHGGLSPDEVATKSGTDVETVRNCTDLWRRTMPQ
jgi:hypothetical protein